jgi:hypothetical protein
LINSYNNAIAYSAGREIERDIRHMHPDDLKAIWICHECRMVFVFHSDVEDHTDLSGHKTIEKAMMILPPETLA